MPSIQVTVPALGESVAEGTLTRWLKKVGDIVDLDEPLFEISTDKVDTEVPSPAAGVLQELLAAEDDIVMVGAVIAVLDQAGASHPEEVEQQSAPVAAAQGPVSGSQEAERAIGPSKKIERPHTSSMAEPASQAARTAPARLDVELRMDDGTRTPEVPTTNQSEHDAGSSQLRGHTVPMSRLRKVIAQRMLDSLATSAQLTSVIEVDVTAAANIRDAAKRDFISREGVRLSFLPFFARAALDALKHHPTLNAVINDSDGTITYHDTEHLAIAVETDKGLLAPVIKNAGELSITGLARKISDLADRARTDRLRAEELTGGTFTLTNTGSRGALFDTPILNQPQVGILGTGSVVRRPVVLGDKREGESIAIRDMAFVSLTYDHRLVDGADAARYLTDVKRRLESGLFDL